ncbi:MAG: hypothetical protein U1A25_02735, partial [Candidatus Sungbacteria bacterium]|nr:hypothetical protein [Candidatus Sungbacteria bacterium]
LLVAAFFTIKRVIPEPTCFDNKRNQNESGVDCGGSSCFSCELKYPRPITVFWARAVAVNEESYDLAAEIENSNERLSSVAIEYEFTLYDDFGPVTKQIGKTYLYAQERTLVVEPNIQTMRRATRAEFRILRADWLEKNETKPTIIAERRAYKVIDEQGRKTSEVEITLFNQTPYDFREVEVHVAVLDKDENLLGVNKILVENLLSQTRQMVKSLWTGELQGTVAVIKVEPRVNIFDPHMIIKPE